MYIEIPLCSDDPTSIPITSTSALFPYFANYTSDPSTVFRGSVFKLSLQAHMIAHQNYRLDTNLNFPSCMRESCVHVYVWA